MPRRPLFTLVPLRARHDGWRPERQVGFIEALAETACVVQAAAAVGLSATAAYNLRRRPEAQAFRLAWDAPLDPALLAAALGIDPRVLRPEDVDDDDDY